MIELAAIWIYPVKSLAGVRLDVGHVGPLGLAGDRRFMIVDAAGRFLTQREHPSLARLGASIEGDDVVIRAADGDALRLPTEGGAHEHEREVVVWKDRLVALDQGDDAAAWLASRIEHEARLVRMSPHVERRADPRFARETDRVAFADGFPFLLLSEESLADLNARLEDPVDMRRFRPNLVVRGATPFAEDRWRTLAIGPITFHVTEGCSRCAIVSVDPDRGVRQKEPLATLGTYRMRDKAVWFGQNLVHDGEGPIHVGDPVTVTLA